MSEKSKQEAEDAELYESLFGPYGKQMHITFMFLIFKYKYLLNIFIVKKNKNLIPNIFDL